MIYLSGIYANEVGYVESDVRPLIQKALDHARGEWTVDLILENVKTGDMQLWIGHEDDELYYVCITRIENYPSGYKTCLVLALAGFNIDDWLQNINELEKWCEHHGVEAIRLQGRKGWERKLKNYGFDHAYTVLERKVERRH
jgi:hypothetical protein